MAIIERPSTVPAVVGDAASPALVTPTEALGVFKRPVSSTGWKSWIFTVDHKKLGHHVRRRVAVLLPGGWRGSAAHPVAAGSPRQHRAQRRPVQPDVHDARHHHGVPVRDAHGRRVRQLLPAAADRCPRRCVPPHQRFGFWLFLFGGIFLNTSWILGGAADGGWFMYSPNSSPFYSPSNGIDFWVLGLQITGIASLVGAINLIVTIINMRAPGMSLMRMPVFTWMQLVTQFLLLFAMPVITVALFLLSFQRNFGAAFFDVEKGADPLLWQHLFWIFGHPEVYIIILPSFGIISEVLPTFARKPLFGYKFVVFSGAAIGFVGWGVWAHHMFASGLGPVSVAVFSVATMLVAIPTGVKITNWVLTLWGGKLWFTTAMNFAIGVIVLFTIGGLSGVTHASATADTQQTDTYHIVAHFHYVIVGGAVMGLFAGFYYWWPKMFGKLLSERLGKWNFWLMFFGVNLTFAPMHILGMQGQPRRMVVWPKKLTGEGFFNLGFWNQVATWGSFMIAAGVLLFIINVFVTSPRRRAKAPLDPWDARTLEWITASPPKEHNFDASPPCTRSTSSSTASTRKSTPTPKALAW
jgi:cytochrome c oxidase subunit 1